MVYTSVPPSPARPLLPRILPYLLMLLIGYLGAVWYGRWNAEPLHDPNAEPRPITPRGDLAMDEQSTIELFRSNAPSVVFITTITREFDVFSFNETELSRGTGSGFLWDEKGHVVTNDHVIASADRAQVTLADKTVWDAKHVGRAPGKDLAVVKISAPAETLRPIVIGRSSDLQVGQKVYAIGNPFGLDHTLTTGVISALDREITTSDRTTVNARRTIDGVIQTDAAINPGNSGGPLLDSGGRLIGVNTAIYSPSGAYAGVGFAIPVDTVNRIVPQLIRHGRIMRPDIGIVPFRDRQIVDIDGVLIREVEGGSPAMEAGLEGTQIVGYRRGLQFKYRFRLGDLIVAANGQPIKDLDDWFTFLEGQNVGDVVALTVVRGLGSRPPREQKLEVQVRLRRAP